MCDSPWKVRIGVSENCGTKNCDCKKYFIGCVHCHWCQRHMYKKKNGWPERRPVPLFVVLTVKIGKLMHVKKHLNARIERLEKKFEKYSNLKYCLTNLTYELEFLRKQLELTNSSMASCESQLAACLTKVISFQPRPTI